jgi:cell division protein FtsQ
MDGGGRLGQSLGNWFGALAESSAHFRAQRAAHRRAQTGLHIPRGIGSSAAILFVLACGTAGFFMGGHYETLRTEQGTIRDMLARGLGFGIRHIGVSGNVELTQDEVIRLAGVMPTDSLPFLDPQQLQTRLAAVPMVSEASVTKLYPDRLLIQVHERVPYALWQQDGRVQVISEDGTPIETLSNHRVKEFAALVEAVPELKDRIRAGILVSERRWTLKLKNGVDIRLPEAAPEVALKTFAEIERKATLTDRGVLAIDLRLADRITVRLTDEAAAVHAETIREKVKKWGGKA